MRQRDSLKMRAQLRLRGIPGGRRLLVSILLLGGWWGISSSLGAIAQSATDVETENLEAAETESSDRPEPAQYLRPRTACPRDVEILTAGLLRDLPGYANRVARRSLGLNEDIVGFGTVLVAGRAEFEPLDITPRTFSDPDINSQETIQQVFFTTLERQYSGTEVLNLEHYHWLFLTEAEDGWRLALMFSRVVVDDDSIRPPTPPRESSEGITGQAVRLWLRDCRAGAVYPIDVPATTEDGGIGL